MFKQKKKHMIYVLYSLHLNSADTDQDRNHAGKPWSEMSFHSSLFSVMKLGCKMEWKFSATVF